MKVSKAQVAQNRSDILDAAAKLYREQGFRGIGMADITRAAGLTHGGLYRHFESKEAMAAQACSRAFDWALSRLDSPGLRGDFRPGAIANSYLSIAHRDDPGNGCPVAALAVDVGREGGAIGQAFVAGLERYLDAFTRHRPDGTVVRTAVQRDRERAIDMVTQLVGALVLARATAAAAPALSEEILRTASGRIGARFK